MIYRSQRARKRYREKIFINIFIRIFAPLIFIFALTILFFNSQIFKIQNISVKNNLNISETEIKKIIWEGLQGKYLNFYDKNNFLFYPKKELLKNTYQQNEALAKIKISYQNLISRNLIVEVEEKIPIYLFCQDIKKKNCYFMESSGNIFSPYNPNWQAPSKDESLIFIKNFQGEKIKSILPEKDFAKLKSFILDLENLDLKIKEIIFLENQEIVLKTSSGVSLVILIEQDLKQVIKNLIKITNTDDLKIDSTKKDFKNKVKYINLIFDKNIYYCLAGAECENNY